MNGKVKKTSEKCHPLLNTSDKICYPIAPAAEFHLCCLLHSWKITGTRFHIIRKIMGQIQWWSDQWWSDMLLTYTSVRKVSFLSRKTFLIKEKRIISKRRNRNYQGQPVLHGDKCIKRKCAYNKCNSDKQLPSVLLQVLCLNKAK